jgi:hypothetical protein
MHGNVLPSFPPYAGRRKSLERPATHTPVRPYTTPDLLRCPMWLQAEPTEQHNHDGGGASRFTATSLAQTAAGGNASESAGGDQPGRGPSMSLEHRHCKWQPRMPAVLALHPSGAIKLPPVDVALTRRSAGFPSREAACSSRSPDRERKGAASGGRHRQGRLLGGGHPPLVPPAPPFSSISLLGQPQRGARRQRRKVPAEPAFRRGAPTFGSPRAPLLFLLSTRADRARSAPPEAEGTGKSGL